MNESRKVSDILAALKVGVIVAACGGIATAAVAALGLTSSATIAPMTVGLAMLVGVAHYWKTMQAQITTEQSRTVARRFKALEEQIAETQGLVQLSGAALPYPLAFGGDYALTADAAAVLARRVTLRRPRIVVELGSGVSTILVAKLLENLGGGRIYSLEHDPAWAAETRKHIVAAGLEEHAEVLDAPVTQQQVEGRNYLWYKIPAQIRALEQIDLLIVDGPPQRLDPEGLPRYPALPKLLPQLSESAEIFVDDAKRAAEREMVRLWLERFPGWQAQQLRTVPGTCLLLRVPRPGEHSEGA